LHADRFGDIANPDHYVDAILNRDLFSEDSLASTRVTSIFIEATPCYGYCPTFSARIDRTGNARYFGVASVPRVGCHEGRISAIGFQILSRIAEDIGFFEMKDSYVLMQTDSSSVFTAAVRGGQIKVIWNHSNAGPAVLWLFQKLILDTLDEIEWRETESSHENCIGYLP
jgi:hypothetical protein